MANLVNYLKCNNSFKIFTILLFIIILLPIAYTLIYYAAPEIFQESLKLNTQNPQLWQYFTSSIVHNGVNHLNNNIISYTIAIAIGLFFSIYSKNLKVFLILILISIFIFPILWSVLRIFFLNSIFPSAFECGSSGVISVFLGLLPILFISSISKYTGKFLVFPEYFYCFLIFIAYLLQETYKTMNISPTMWVLYFTFLILFFIFFLLYLNKLRITLDSKKSYILSLVLLIVFLIFYTGLIGFLFPQQLVSQEGRTAIETHYIGVLFGLGISYVIIALSENPSFRWLKC